VISDTRVIPGCTSLLTIHSDHLESFVILC